MRRPGKLTSFLLVGTVLFGQVAPAFALEIAPLAGPKAIPKKPVTKSQPALLSVKLTGDVVPGRVLRMDPVSGELIPVPDAVVTFNREGLTPSFASMSKDGSFEVVDWTPCTCGVTVECPGMQPTQFEVCTYEEAEAPEGTPECLDLVLPCEELVPCMPCCPPMAGGYGGGGCGYGGGCGGFGDLLGLAAAGGLAAWAINEDDDDDDDRGIVPIVEPTPVLP